MIRAALFASVALMIWGTVASSAQPRIFHRCPPNFHRNLRGVCVHNYRPMRRPGPFRPPSGPIKPFAQDEEGSPDEL